MAQVTQRLALFLTANASQAQATLGRIPGSFLNIGRSARTAAQDTTLVNQQMRALGTTLKYMVAGGMVYGTMNMVRNLAQFQQQLGLISAIGTQAGFGLVGKGLDDLKMSIMGASTELITPASDVADAVTNLVSSVQAGQGLNRNDIIPAVIEIGKAARLSQTPVEDMTKGLTAMNVAFGRPVSLKNISDLAAKWTDLISMVPGGVSAAPQLVSQLGGLAGSARMAAISPGALMGLISGVLRFGIVPSQTGQGLSYLLRTLATPEAPSTVKSAKQMFAQLGISNDWVQQHGGVAALVKVFQAASSAGIRGVNRNTAQRALAQGQSAGGMIDEGDISGLGISGAGVNVLATVFRRQHALRTAIALYSMWQTGQLGKDLNTLGDSIQSIQKQQHDFAQMWKEFAAQSGLAKAGTALQNIRLQVSQGLAPIFNLASRPIPWLQGVMQHHKGITEHLSQAGFGVIAALGLNKFIGSPLGRIPGIGRIPILGNILGAPLHAAVMAKAVEDALKGTENMQPGLSPENPLYVVVVDQLVQSKSGSGGTLGKVEDEAKRVPWIIGRFGGIGNLARLGFTRVGLPVAVGLGAAWATKELSSLLGDKLLGPTAGAVTFKGLQFTRQGMILSKRHSGGLFGFGGGDVIGALGMMGNRAAEIQAARKLHTTFQNVQRLERYFQTPGIQELLKNNNDKLVAAITGTGTDLTLDLTVVQNGKAVARKKVHLPPDTPHQGGTTPGTRGRKKVMKKVTTSMGHA